MKTYKIHLIRHGLTQENFEGRYLGQTDSPLCEAGKSQLEQMREEMTYPTVEAVFSSPLCRCTETAKILFPDQECIVLEDLKEYDFGEWDGLSAEDLEDNEAFKEWLAGGPDSAPPYGESNAEFGRRVAAIFMKIIEGLGKTGTRDAAIITHGGVIMSIMSMFALPEAGMTEWLTPNGCGFTVRVTPSLWSKMNKVEAIEEIPYVELSEEEEAEYLLGHPELSDFGTQMSGFNFVDLGEDDD